MYRASVADLKKSGMAMSHWYESSTLFTVPAGPSTPLLQDILAAVHENSILVLTPARP